MKKIFSMPQSLKDASHLYCPGCGHGIIHRIVAEVIDELALREKTIGVAPVGCAVFAYDYFNFDVTEAAHGRPPAVATGIKRMLPDRVVFTYQGDGDLAAIGASEIIHAGARGENITVIFVNNANYGMTGGQMAPTTLLNQMTTTTPVGRAVMGHGFPIRVAELISALDGVSYIERTAVNNPKNILRSKAAVKKAFQIQLQNIGLSFVEILSQCPVTWKMSPEVSIKWIDDVLSKYYPLGVIKEVASGN